MNMLARDDRALFLGQGVGEGGDGVATYADFEGIPMDRRIELPVMEEMQMGMGIGLALQGYLPVLVYPRCDFLLRAMDQLVNHLDKLPAMSCGDFKPKVIIRTRVGSKAPLDAGPQHTNDYGHMIRGMCRNVEVFHITEPWQIIPTYEIAIDLKRPSLIVEAL